MTTIKAHFDGKAFVPDDPVKFSQNQPVTLHIAPLSKAPGTPTRLEERLAMLEKIKALAIECDAPEADFSRDSIYSGNSDDPR